MEMDRRNFLGGLLMASAALPLRSFGTDEVVEGKGVAKSSRKNPILSYAQFEVGAEKPFSILHISDTHLTAAYPGEYPLRLQTSESRTKAFGGGQEEALRVCLEWARSATDYVLHTGDLIDFQSDANLDLVRKYFGTDVKMFGSLGNHEHYTRRSDLKGEKAKVASRKALAGAYPFDLSFASNVINGVNFVALDNAFGKVTAEQAERFEAEVAKGHPIILCCHVPFYTDCIARAWARYWRDRGKKFRSAGVPSPRDDRKSQLEDPVTQEFVAKLKSQPLLRGILSGHLHVAVADRFSPTAMEYVVGANFDYSACEVLVV